jgi:uncharacterized damage-inducible protein DinB
MDPLRQELLGLLDGGAAHVRVLDAMRGIPAAARGRRPAGAAHSAWELVEHMRRAQADILHYCTRPRHRSPPFPDGYWPRQQAPTDGRAFGASVAAFRADLAALGAVVRDRKVDLLARIPHLEVSWLHELVIVANHNSYHAGQLVQLRKQLAGAGST